MGLIFARLVFVLALLLTIATLMVFGSTSYQLLTGAFQ